MGLDLSENSVATGQPESDFLKNCVHSRCLINIGQMIDLKGKKPKEEE